MTPGCLRGSTVKTEEKETMPQSSKSARAININRSYRSHVVACCDRMRRLSLLAASMFAFALIAVATAHGQGAFGSSPQDNAVEPGGGVSSPLTTTTGSTISQAPEDARSIPGNSSSLQAPSTFSQ